MRCSTGGPARSLTVGEMPGVTLEQARLYTDLARREVDMVFQFEPMSLDHGATKWDVRPLDLGALKENFRRWQAGLADVGWNSLYWNNHDQPRAVSRFGSDAPEHRVASAKLLATVLHLHHGTPYVYQGEELGMTNTAFAGIEDFRDIESVNHSLHARAAGRPAAEVLAALRAHEQGQRSHPDALGRVEARRLHRRHAVDRGQPEPRGGQRGRPVGRRTEPNCCSATCLTHRPPPRQRFAPGRRASSAVGRPREDREDAARTGRR